MVITAVAMLTTTWIALVGQINGQVFTSPSHSEEPNFNKLLSNIRSTELIANGTTEQTEGNNNISNVTTTIVSRGLAANATIDNRTGTNQITQQQRQLSLQYPLSSLQPPLVSLVPSEQTLQVPGALQQSSENMSSSVSSTSLPHFSEYNNSKYGFKIQYPSDWKVNSTANVSLSSPLITGASTDVVASITSPSDLQRGRQGLVTIGVENLSEGASQQANGNLTAYDYAAPIIKRLSLPLGSATERDQTNLVRNESLNIGSETSSKNSKNLSAWRIDTIASDYKSDVFVINGTRVFDIGFSAPKESATQSLPIFDKMLNSFQFTGTTPNVTANEDTLSTTDIANASVTNNQSSITLNEIVQQKPLSQLSSSLIPLSSQQQQEPSTFQTEQQQQPLPPPSNISQQQPPSNISQQQPPSNISQQQPPSNISQQQPPSNISQQLQQQQQQPLLGHVMEQQQPVFQQPPLAQQQQLSSIQQQPTAQAPSTIQQLPTQLMQTSSSTPSSPSTMSTDSTSALPPSTPNQATTTASSTGTPSTMTQQSSGPAPASTPPPTTSPSPPTAQQQLSSIYQQPAAPQAQSTLQQLPAQPLFQTSPQPQSLLQSNPAQPYGIPSTTATIQPQLSALPPTATTFPPSVLPPVNSLQPYGTTGGLGYPSTFGGQYGLGAAGSAAGAAATSVSTSSQLVSPWFPSLPATYCGGTFLLTIEGTPRGDGDKNNKIEPADNNNRKDNNGGGDNDDNDDHHKNSKDSERERRLLSLQINSDNSRIFTDDDAIFGQIFQGKKNIDENKGNDFDIKSIFNDCQIVTFSKG